MTQPENPQSFGGYSVAPSGGAQHSSASTQPSYGAPQPQPQSQPQYAWQQQQSPSGAYGAQSPGTPARRYLEPTALGALIVGVLAVLLYLGTKVLQIVLPQMGYPYAGETLLPAFAVAASVCAVVAISLGGVGIGRTQPDGRRYGRARAGTAIGIGIMVLAVAIGALALATAEIPNLTPGVSFLSVFGWYF